MQHGTLDDASLKLLTAMTTSLLEVNTETSRAANAQSYATGQLSALISARTQRQSAAESRLPIGVLIAVVLTSLIVGLFPFAGGIRSDRASIGVAVLQAALVAVAAVVVFQLNNPFTGPLRTGPGPVSTVAAEIGARLEAVPNESRPPVGLRGIRPRSDTRPGLLVRAGPRCGRPAGQTERARNRARRVAVADGFGGGGVPVSVSVSDDSQPISTSEPVSEPEHQPHPKPNQSRVLPRPGACNSDTGRA
jgi:hypothetical protein